MATAEIAGQCLCGEVTITVTEPACWIGACHCRMCQRWSGGLWAGFPAAADTVTVKGPIKSYTSSSIATRAFCKNCGTQLWMRDVKAGADYDLMPGMFDDTHDWPLKSEIYHECAMAAFALKGDHRRASSETYREKNPEVIAVSDIAPRLEGKTNE